MNLKDQTFARIAKGMLFPLECLSHVMTVHLNRYYQHLILDFF